MGYYGLGFTIAPVEVGSHGCASQVEGAAGWVQGLGAAIDCALKLAGTAGWAPLLSGVVEWLCG